MLCNCGCDQDAGVFSRTDARRNSVKGEPKRFIQGHNPKSFLERHGVDVPNGPDGKWVYATIEETSEDGSRHWIRVVPDVDGPSWPVVQPATPANIKYVSTGRKPQTHKTTVILPDPQIGFWRLSDGTMIPIHDPQALEVSLAIIELVRPNVIVNLGDFLDLSEWSLKFAVYPEFANTTQAAVNVGHEFLASQISAAGFGKVDIYLLEGNHDDRIPRLITANAKAAMRLHRADEPEGWPVMSVPNLLALDSLNVEYISGYPAGKIKLAEKHDRQTALYALHGEKLDMIKQAKSERQSTVQGHTHHVSLHTEVYEDDGNPYEVESWSLGCLCSTNGNVPSTKGAPDLYGRPVPRHESWTQAVGILTETENNWSLDAVRIRDGKTIFRGQEIRV